MKLPALVIQFAKYPELGRVKTRLAPTLTQQGSYQLHQNLVRHTAKHIQQSGLWHVLALDRIGNHELLQEMSLNIPIILQSGDDLGKKMRNAFHWGLQRAHHVILVGSDCAALEPQHYIQVNQQLEECDHVLFLLKTVAMYWSPLACPMIMCSKISVGAQRRCGDKRNNA